MTELDKLRLKLAELEEQISLARGESCRANHKLIQLCDQQSECFKMIARLTLAKPQPLAMNHGT